MHNMSDIRPEFRPSQLVGHKQFDVPWARAEDIRSRLAKHGIPATAVLEHGERRAAIEVADDVGREAIGAALA